jgi:hypothetical protein
MRKILAFALTGLSMAGIACGKDSTGPSDAMNGLYIGSTSKADIRLQAAYGVDPNLCTGLATAARIVCLAFKPNVNGTGSITLRETGEVQSFEFSALQAAVNVGLTFTQQNGVMLDTRLFGSLSSDATTLQATIYPGTGTPKPSIFGDSAAVTFVRQ